MQANFTVSHAKYTGSTDVDGYSTGDTYGTPTNRLVYGWYPLSSQLSQAAEYDRRVTTSKVVLVPDVSQYSARDKVILPGNDAYFVSEDVRDYNNGPFGYKPGGEIVVEKVTG